MLAELGRSMLQCMPYVVSGATANHPISETFALSWMTYPHGISVKSVTCHANKAADLGVPGSPCVAVSARKRECCRCRWGTAAAVTEARNNFMQNPRRSFMQRLDCIRWALRSRRKGLPRRQEQFYAKTRNNFMQTDGRCLHVVEVWPRNPVRETRKPSGKTTQHNASYVE